MQTHGLLEAQRALAPIPERVGSSLIKVADERAARIQARMQAETALEYNKASTGRFSRGLRARVEKIGVPGGKVKTVIRVTSVNYRETRFLTNIGGGGYFKSFPVRGYRIFVQGVEGAQTLLSFGRRANTLKSGSKAIALIKRSGVGRLKVPRRTAFFTAGRRPGRGGGESRTIEDALGPAGPGDLQKSFFFYPLWVDHPGFRRDVVSDIALEEGASFINQEVALVKGEHAVSADEGIGVSRDIPTLDVKVSRRK